LSAPEKFDGGLKWGLNWGVAVEEVWMGGWARRGVLSRPAVEEASRQPKGGWPGFRLICGPARGILAPVSDRDPGTGRSSWEEIEGRNREALAKRGVY
jgi:hypothetical protein